MLRFRFPFLLSIVTAFLAISSCNLMGAGPCLEGTGESIREMRSVTAFKSIDMRLAGKVLILQGPSPTVSVESFHNLLPKIITEVKGNTLIIRSETCLEFTNEQTTFYVSMPLLEQAELKSSGDLYIESVPGAPKVQLSMSGSGSLNFNGTATNLKLSHSGSGVVLLHGAVRHIETSQTGSGKIQGYFLKADSVKSVLSGSGHQQVWVNQYLDGINSGTGNLYYRGYPSTIIRETSSTGRIINDN